MDQKNIAVQEPQESVSVFSPPPAGETLANQDGERLDVLGAEIRAYQAEGEFHARKAVGCAVEIGRRLTEAKALVPHGKWGDWLKREVDYSQSTAQNMMRIFQELGDQQESLFGPPKSQALGNLSVTKVLRLLSLPEGPERDEFLETHDVESMSTRELEAALRERDEARRAAEQAAADQRAAEEARAKISADMAAANRRLEGLNGELEQSRAETRQAAERAEALERELAELRAKPVEVAVEADPAAIDAARKEAEAAMKAKLDKARDAKKKAEEKQKAAEEDAAQARQDVERLRAQLAAQSERDGKRAAIAANEDLLLFRTLFDQAQELLNKMIGILLKTQPKDPETAGKLAAAVLAWNESVREKVAKR